MRTYKIDGLKENISKLIKPLQTKFAKKIYFFQKCWITVAPEWAKQLKPITLKNKTLVLETKTNALILQYREKELLKICNLIADNEVEKIRISYI